MPKRKYTRELKIEVCMDKENNGLSNAELALKYSIPKTTIREWIQEYEKSGHDAFKVLNTRKNNTYTADFRVAVVKEKLEGNVSYHELGRKYGINKCVVQSWVYKYREKGEEALLTDSRGSAGRGRPPKSVSKTEISKKDKKSIKTKNESGRIQIKKYCINKKLQHSCRILQPLFCPTFWGQYKVKGYFKNISSV